VSGHYLELFCLLLGLIVTVGPMLARRARTRNEDQVDDDFEPTVTVVTPMFNEGEGIRQVIRSVLAQDYPAHKLHLIVVDDCSTDDSYEHAKDEARGELRVMVLRNDVNMGKRRSINRAVRASKAEIIVSVDSDVTIDRRAVRELVRRFTSPEIAAVGGRVDIRNKRTNWLTRMQAVKYYFGYHVIKNLERAYRTVMCLSGCLTAYRRKVLVELEPVLENRSLLGMQIKYGEDRFLTRQIIKAGHKTTMTMDAICCTEAPAKLDQYAGQQLRWRRSTIVDYLGSISHIRRMHPLVAMHYYSVFGLIIAYPALLISSIADGTFLPVMAAQLGVVVSFGLFYRWQVRKLPADQRVSAASFLPMAVVVPITYAILTPLAVLTLGNRNWGTRGHQAPASEPVLEVESKIDRAIVQGSAIQARATTAGGAVASKEVAA
jgi:cellulose synthase/poly-beta-1,6-N-acetylglucosamine synthase-like glycosyltransferase